VAEFIKLKTIKNLIIREVKIMAIEIDYSAVKILIFCETLFINMQPALY